MQPYISNKKICFIYIGIYIYIYTYITSLNNKVNKERGILSKNELKFIMCIPHCLRHVCVCVCVKKKVN